MDREHILITGGAGFVGANLGLELRREFPDCQITALDNLKRRGSELNLDRLRAEGVQFVHADIRCPEDLAALPRFNLLIDCSAEPSVHAGTTESPRYLLNTNLLGAWNCLEAARERRADFLFLSTSRVYPIAALNNLPYREEVTRYCWEPPLGDGAPGGFSAEGISEEFPLDGPKSFYGASKLAGELLVQEYVYQYGMRAIINRCGVLTGPWQMGKVDQGIVTLWVARHHFKKPLQYLGFGGQGKQVRDVLHVSDLADLVVRQVRERASWNGEVYNVGGGPENTVSLEELTRLCRQITGNRVEIQSNALTSPVDIRIYQTNHRKVTSRWQWRPTRGAAQIVSDIHQWIRQRESMLKSILE